MRRAWLVLLLGLLGCSELPIIQAGDCGNKVVEQNENCDSFAPYPGAVCRAKSTIGECHLDCRRGADGLRPPCPDGWGCDADDLCREPNGAFLAPVTPLRVGGANSLLAGDFDGDQRGDVLSRGLANDLGEAEFQVLHFDRDGLITDARKFERRVGAPVFTDLSGDRRSDIVFPLFGVGLVPGQLDRSLVPETFRQFEFPGSAVRQVSLIRGQVEAQAGVVIMTAIDGMPGLGVVDIQLRFSRRGAMHGTVAALSGDPRSAQVVEGMASPCRELVHGFRNETSFYVTDMCTRDATTGAVRWRQQADQWTVQTEPPSALLAGPEVADLDGDGHTDVLFATANGTYAAYGDGAQLRTAVPFRLAFSNPSQMLTPELEMPLAMADLSGDGVVDFVLPKRIVVSSKAPGASLPRYDVGFRNTSAPWTSAAIDDLNGNGKLDVAAASIDGSGVDFFNGTGTPVLVSTHIATSGPVAHLATGDFDGDSLRDLVFTEQRQSAQLPDWVNIAYGRAFEPPQASFLAARIAGIDHLMTHDGIGLLSHIEMSTLQVERSLGGVTWLFGSADRVPVSVIDLLNYANDGSLLNSRALSLVSGAFASPTARDVLALAFDTSKSEVSFWLLGNVTGPRDPLVKLPGGFDARLLPVEQRTDGSARVQVTGAAGDLDADKHDEVAFAMPADQGLRCGLATAGVQRLPTPLLLMRNTLVLEWPCRDPQLSVGDADQDGHPDLILLTGEAEAGDRKLVVLWNDGAGGFSDTRLSVVNAPELSPQAFAALARSPQRAFSLAFVTAQALWISTLSSARTFGPAQFIAPLQQGTGIAASDCTGDGLTDLVVANAGDLSVFRADWNRQ